MPTSRRDSRDALVVVVAVALAVSSIVAFVTLAPHASQAPGCRPSAPGTTSPYLTPVNPVLLPNGTSYLVGKGVSFGFCVEASVELEGAWSAGAPVAVAVFPAGIAGTTWPYPGSFSSNGNLSEVLFPGTYFLDVLPGPTVDNALALNVTQAVHAQFDRGLANLLPANTSFNVASNAYLAWSIAGPPIESSVWFTGSYNTSSCHDELALLPAAMFSIFQSNRSVINETGTLPISGQSSHPCPNPAILHPGGSFVLGPITLTPGEVLVYWNMGSTPSVLVVASPFQLSYPEG